MVLALVVAVVLVHLSLPLASGSSRGQASGQQILESSFVIPKGPPTTAVDPRLAASDSGGTATASPVAGYIRSLTPEAPLGTAAPASVLTELVLDLRQAPPPLLPTYLVPQQPITLFVHQGSAVLTIATTRTTIGGALAAVRFPLGPRDYVAPALNSLVTPGIHVYIHRAKRVSIIDGDAAASFYTTTETVGEALREANIALSESDRVEPALESPLQDKIAVSVTRVQESMVTVDEEVPFATLYRDDADIEAGQVQVIQPGRLGLRRQQVRIIYENGKEVSRRVVDSSLESPPQPAIIARGIKPVVNVLETPNGSLRYVRTLRVFATWYNASDGGRSPSDPNYGLTATGVPVDRGIVAVDPNVIPLGTRLYIPGYGPAVAADTGGGIVGNHIDLGFPEGVIPDWLTGWVNIYILDQMRAAPRPPVDPVWITIYILAP